MKQQEQVVPRFDKSKIAQKPRRVVVVPALIATVKGAVELCYELIPLKK